MFPDPVFFFFPTIKKYSVILGVTDVMGRCGFRQNRIFPYNKEVIGSAYQREAILSFAILIGNYYANASKHSDMDSTF
jgi:hypothetical protein